MQGNDYSDLEYTPYSSRGTPNVATGPQRNQTPDTQPIANVSVPSTTPTPQDDYSDLEYKPFSTIEKPVYEAPELSEARQIENKFREMPWYQRWAARNFTAEGAKLQGAEATNNLKALLYGATAGWSDYFIPALKPDWELGRPTALGYKLPGPTQAANLAGAVAPMSLTAKGLTLAFQGLSNLFRAGPTIAKLGPYAKTALEYGHHALTGAAYGTEKELANVAKGDEFDPLTPVEDAVAFVVLPALINGLIKYSPKGREWFNSLKPKQAEQFVKGQLPDNLTPDQAKAWQDTVAPDWMEQWKKNYEIANKEANTNADVKFQQDNAIAKANHEKKLYEAHQESQLDQARYDQEVAEYEAELEQIFKEHEAKKSEIEANNRQAQQEFEQAQKDFTNMRTRQEAVQQATALRPGEQNQPYRRSETYVANPSLSNQVGNIVSRNEATNSTNAGEALFGAIRANAAVDREIVTMAYDEGLALARGVEQTHPILLGQLEAQAAELQAIPHLSAPQQSKLSFIRDIINRLRTVRTIDGRPEIRMNPVTNDILHEQAKAMRYEMDYTFQHGNTKGIYQPTVDALENAQTLAAEAAGNREAAQALTDARTLYREWSSDYNNDYINPYREVNNRDFSGKFKQITNNPDQFNAVNNILNRSNAGQQIAQVARRSAVEAKLQTFLDNPHSASGREFEKTLNELYAYGITPEQASEIRGAFNAARNAPIITEPKAPKLEQVKEPKLPEFNKPRPSPKEVTEPAPIAKRVVKKSNAMKVAEQQMKKTPEQLKKLSDSPSGLKQLKENLSPDVFDGIKWEKTREVLYGGEVQPRGLTGSKVVDRLNNAHNFSLMSELHGEKVALDMLESAKLIKESPFTKEAILRTTKNIGLVRILARAGLLGF